MKPKKAAFYDESKFGEENINEFFELFKKETEKSDRSTAILLSAYIEDLLDRLLKKSLVSEAAYEEISSNLTPERLVRLCYLTGLIHEEVKKDLDTIRKIRGKFAHKIDINSFDHEGVAALCDEFCVMEYLRAKYSQWAVETGRDRYIAAAVYYISYLFSRINISTRIKESPKPW
jgi:hypothetical protein